jgi:hypothetical protein
MQAEGNIICILSYWSALMTPRRPSWTACVHFRNSYPIDVSHLSFNFLCLLLLFGKDLGEDYSRRGKNLQIIIVWLHVCIRICESRRCCETVYVCVTV